MRTLTLWDLPLRSARCVLIDRQPGLQVVVLVDGTAATREDCETPAQAAEVASRCLRELTSQSAQRAPRRRRSLRREVELDSGVDE